MVSDLRTQWHLALFSRQGGNKPNCLRPQRLGWLWNCRNTRKKWCQRQLLEQRDCDKQLPNTLVRADCIGIYGLLRDWCKCAFSVLCMNYTCFVLYSSMAVCTQKFVILCFYSAKSLWSHRSVLLFSSRIASSFLKLSFQLIVTFHYQPISIFLKSLWSLHWLGSRRWRLDQEDSERSD